MCVFVRLDRFSGCGDKTLSAKQERNEQAKPPDAGQLKVKVIRAVERNSKIFRNQTDDLGGVSECKLLSYMLLLCLWGLMGKIPQERES